MQNIVLDHLNTVVIVLDQEFRVVTLNPAAENLLDTSLKRVLNQPVTTVIPEENFKADLDRSLGQNQQFTRRETDFPINGEMINVDYSISPINCGEARLLLEINPRDRVQKISREESLIAKQETSRILVRGLAHEVKNPLGGIRGAAQLLARELDDQGLNEFTDIIIREADRLRDLVDQMLGPLQPPKMADLNIHEVLERVIQLINAETGGELRLKRDYDPSIPDIPGDFERLIQAILNLVRNAMQAIDQAMPRCEGRITLRTRIARQFTIGTQRQRLVCHLSIIDNGPGIPPDLIDNIFYPMISGRADGTGLGLPMAQSIISLHQGLVECESKPGETIFNVFLPIIREPLSLGG
ncbi:nitrogen regulation protein NR(II) [Endozoicomonas sp. SCSIO W0465]|uniref:nitrogen regulation protein NR(II) n=1 Tax=Endozoicomonas sp. SCSIO W0465 TaxID=2918516 RepID=UPI002075FA1B|nr:nitrogen regulation protein NR(II) [Endozoicomonas sp. SCSIO W0465]USE37064.1 nitrogen regulation protein NR(II) [Endozoicomonas sp. SCSIO W0465]